MDKEENRIVVSFLSANNDLIVSTDSRALLKSLLMAFPGLLGDDESVTLPRYYQIPADFRATFEALLGPGLKSMPELNNVLKFTSTLRDYSWIRVLPRRWTIREEVFTRLVLKALNTDPQGLHSELVKQNIWKPFTDWQKCFGGRYYELVVLAAPPLKGPRYFGERNPDKRICRFCGGTKASGARFKTKAHLIPEGLGNKALFAREECDDCNLKLGRTIDSALVTHFDLMRTFLGVKGKQGMLTLPFKNGRMVNTQDGLTLYTLDNPVSVEEQSDQTGTFSYELQHPREYRDVDVYRSLVRSALHLLPADTIVKLKDTIRWLNDLTDQSLPLPRVATCTDSRNYTEFPTLKLFKAFLGVSGSVPDYVAMLHVGPLIIGFVLPDRTTAVERLTKPGEFEKFWAEVGFGGGLWEWSFSSLSDTQNRTTNYTLEFKQWRGALDDKEAHDVTIETPRQ